MLHLWALALASATPLPTDAPTPGVVLSPVPVATVNPEPSPTVGAPEPSPLPELVTPPVPEVSSGFDASAAGVPSGDIAGDDQPFVGITLDDAVSMALFRNTDLAISQSNRRIAGYQIVAAKGAYDVRFMLQPSYTVAIEPVVSSLQAGPGNGPITQVAAEAEAGFTGLTSTGGSYKISTTAERIDNNFEYNSYDPYYETSLGFTFTQPLARNFGIDETKRELEIARIGRQYSDDSALLTASNTLDSVLVAYDNLVGAWKNVGISEQALRQAKAQEQSNVRLVKHGAAAPVDIAESDTQVAEFQNDVYSAIANVASLQNQLKSLLLANPADPLWTANLVPVTPPISANPEPKISDLIESALEHRPEVAQLRENIREENVNVAYQKNQERPQIDLNLGVTENGFAGAPQNINGTPLFGVIGSEITDINTLIARSNAANPALPALVPINASALTTALPANTIGKIGEAYGSSLRGQYPEYSISATLSFPLRNRTAEANYAAEVERRQSLQTQEVALIQRVQLEARNAVQTYRSAHSRLTASIAGRRNAEIVAASELRKFKAGASTTFLVLQRQVALANARSMELQAQTDFQRAQIELDRVSGTILTNYHVDVKTIGSGSEGAVRDLVSPAAQVSPAPEPSTKP